MPNAMALRMVALWADYALNVKGRVCLRIAQALGFLQHGGEVEPLVPHLAEDEIGRAIDDARDPLDSVRGQAFTQGLDDGNAPSDRRFKADHDATCMRGCKDFSPMDRQQRLVGSDHVLARRNGLHHQFACDAVAADQFDHDIDRRVGNHSPRIRNHLHLVADQ